MNIRESCRVETWYPLPEGIVPRGILNSQASVTIIANQSMLFCAMCWILTASGTLQGSHVPRLNSSTSWAYDCPLCPPRTKRYDPTWVAVCDNRLYVISVWINVQIKVSTPHSSARFYFTVNRKRDTRRFKTWISANEAWPSLPPKTIILSPTRLAEWYPFFWGISPFVLHSCHVNLFGSEISSAQTSFRAAWPLPPPKINRWFR